MTDIEGWGAGVSRPWLDDTTRREWLGAVHRALRAEAPPGRVLGEVREPGPGWNYCSVRIQTGHRLPQRLLLNAAARLVACASDEDFQTFGPLHFYEVPGPEVFAAAGFNVASRGELETQLRPSTSPLSARTNSRTSATTDQTQSERSCSIGSTE